jgi:hypothetical protein
MSGSQSTGASGVYGTQGMASGGNVPGARSGAVSWSDTSGNLWLFGGSGVDASGTSGALNDLWRFNPSTKSWAWIAGGKSASVYGGSVTVGVYGTRGVPAATNLPGPRNSAVSWVDHDGNFWLFGGAGYTSSTTGGMFNDLWEYSPTVNEWTWVSGSNTTGSAGVYGTLGVPSAGNSPSARGSGGGGNALGWVDSAGNLWLFGGDSSDDLWEFSISSKEWTWVKGSNSGSGVAIYGTLGTASPRNTPGARNYSVSWTDKSGNLWLYGGESTGVPLDLSDLWQFSPTVKEWTWVSGSNQGGVAPVYGSVGASSASNTPGGRDSAVAWADSKGNLWLFGGFDYDSVSGANGTNQYLNDLWKFDTSKDEWTWMGGSDTGNALGVYGTLGTPSGTNVPGARGSEGIPVAWTDSSDNFWLFGGEGNDSSGFGSRNDLWRYQP